MHVVHVADVPFPADPAAGLLPNRPAGTPVGAAAPYGARGGLPMRPATPPQVRVADADADADFARVVPDEPRPPARPGACHR